MHPRPLLHTNMTDLLFHNTHLLEWNISSASICLYKTITDWFPYIVSSSCIFSMSFKSLYCFNDLKTWKKVSTNNTDEWGGRRKCLYRKARRCQNKHDKHGTLSQLKDRQLNNRMVSLFQSTVSCYTMQPQWAKKILELKSHDRDMTIFEYMTTHLVFHTKILHQADEESGRPVMGTVQQQALGAALSLGLQIAGYNCSVHSFLCHVTIGCPLSSYTSMDSIQICTNNTDQY